MTREELVKIIDAACWQARKLGHDDNGLDEWGVDIDGNEVDPDERYAEAYHPSAVEAADKVRAMLANADWREAEGYR